MEACGRIWGGVGSVAGGGEGTVRRAWGCGCVGGGWWAVSAVFGWGRSAGGASVAVGEIVLSADPARAVYVQSPMHGVHTWLKVLVWTPETLRASQSERDTSVLCLLSVPQ